VLASCTSLHVPAKPPVFERAELRERAAEGLLLRARPIGERERSLELFDDDLPALGIAPMWVVIENGRPAAVDLRRAGWSLEVDGRRETALSSETLLDRFYANRKIRVYSLKADADARRALESLLFRPALLPPAGSASGFLFFKIDPTVRTTWARRGRLALRGVDLGEGRSLEVVVPLAHAAP
jgi:hypothetical protein